MSLAGDAGTAGLNFASSTSVLGLGLLGRGLGTVLALTRDSTLASLMGNFLAEPAQPPVRPD
jgi:hypothetical protein